MNRLFVVFLLSPLFLGLGQAQEKFKSNYGEFPKCQDGQAQTPIDILSASATCDAAKAGVTFNWQRKATLKGVLLQNDGETAFLTGNVFTENTVLDGAKYVVNLLNFHWGKVGEKGSEHSVDGAKYDGELEIVHLKEGFTDFDTSFDTDGNAMVVSLFFKEDSSLAEDIALVRGLTASFPHIVEKGSNFTVPFDEQTLSLSQFIPKDSSFYRYSGSISVTPCTEGIERIVFKEPLKVTSAFFTALRTLKGKDDALLESSVNRPVQALNARTIYKSSE